MDINVSDIDGSSHQPSYKYRKLGAYQKYGASAQIMTQLAGQDAPTRPLTGLAALPAEILAIILDISKEASLIHTCRQLWLTLPSFKAYTSYLLFKAVVPLEDQAAGVSVPEVDLDVQAATAGMTISAQKVVRDDIFSSRWLQMHHLDIIHMRLANRRIRQMYLAFGQGAPSKGQMQRIRSWRMRCSMFGTWTELILRLRCDGERSKQLMVTRECVALYAGWSQNGTVRLQTWELDGTVPDLFFRLPVANVSLLAIQRAFGPVNSNPVVSQGHILPHISQVPLTTKLRCNGDLLGEAILEAMAAGAQYQFHWLMCIEAQLNGCWKAPALDYRHIDCAVVCGHSRMLIQIFTNISRFSQQPVLQEECLLSLMNRAKEDLLPRWMASCKVLAMEVAAIWKMRQVLKDGFEVARVRMVWPPELTITKRDENGVGAVSSWFLPQEHVAKGQSSGLEDDRMHSQENMGFHSFQIHQPMRSGLS